MKLTKEEFKQELMYLVSKSILKDMLIKNIIDEEQYLLIKKEIKNIYHPLIASLYEEY